MKTSTTFYKILVLAISLALLSSCVKIKNSKISASVAEHGVILAQNAQTYLELSRKLAVNHEIKREYLKIVNDLSPEQYEMTYEINFEEDLQNIYKIKAMSSLKSVFLAYQLQSDIKVSEKKSGVRSKIFASCLALDSIDVSEEIRTNSEKLRKNIYNKKFKLKQAIYLLTDIYASFWRDESLLIFKKMQALHKESNAGIRSIPNKAFDATKLKKLVKDPYNNEYVLANLYKLQMLEENNQKFIDLEGKMQKISAGFALLTELQAEILKRKKQPMRQQELNNELDALLK